VKIIKTYKTFVAEQTGFYNELSRISLRAEEGGKMHHPKTAFLKI